MFNLTLYVHMLSIQFDQLNEKWELNAAKERIHVKLQE